jgi:hypothetical protein
MWRGRSRPPRRHSCRRLGPQASRHPQGQQNCHRADEWDNAELAELSQIQDFMVDFRLTDEGELDFHAFGERALDDI